MSAPASLPRKQQVLCEAQVVEVRRETADTATLVLEVLEGQVDYRAGQFINIDPHQFPALNRFTHYLEELKGRKEPIRSYSLASAPHERHLAITVQDEEYAPGRTLYPPLLSPYLVHGLPKGSRLHFTGFLGPYLLPPDVEERAEHVVHVVAGSGVVPNFSILKDALQRGLKVRHTLICSNKTYADILFREELDALEKAHPQKLRILHTLTRETDRARLSDRVREGRVDQALLAELVPDPTACLLYVCGPAITPWDRRKALETQVPATPRFIETVLGALHEMGVTDKHIKREVYG